jgi:dolichol-phosphate mannosyltransferase
MKLSLVIPAHNEEGCIEKTLRNLSVALERKKIPHELLVVNDNSQDQTEAILIQLENEIFNLRYINNPPPNGFGLAVRTGLENFQGDVVAVVMADGSDLPVDVVSFYETIQKGYDCVFGSRFNNSAKVIDYPKIKLILNRIVNFGIRILFRLNYNDITNAFKMYRAEVIPGLKPFLSHHFNLTVELPLKAIIRGYSYTVVPNSWLNRCSGESKLKIKEMGSRYLFIILYCFIEKWLSRGDFITNSQKKGQRITFSGNNKRTI